MAWADDSLDAFIPTTTNPIADKPEPLAHVVVGLLLSNGDARLDRYQCPFPTCAEISFGRPAELKRHHASRHKGYGSRKPRYWCPVQGCNRSKTGKRGPFPRKDKMMDHLERIHRDEVGGE